MLTINTVPYRSYPPEPPYIVGSILLCFAWLLIVGIKAVIAIGQEVVGA